MSQFILSAQSLAELANRAGLPKTRRVVLEVLESERPLRLAAGTNSALYPASMIKTPLVAAAFVQVAEGKFTLNDCFVVTAANMTANDAFSPLTVGYESSLAEITDRAITFSDNVATNMLFDIVGRERATDIARARFGLQSTAFHRKLSGSEPLIDDPEWNGTDRNAHSADDAVTLFAAIAHNRIPYADRLRASLAAQHWNEKLNLGLHVNDAFAHKTGDTDEVTHDGGILTTAPGRRYAIAVYTEFASNNEHNACLGVFMRLLRPAL